MADLYEARVFCDNSGHFGDRHGIIIDEKHAIDSSHRLAIAAKLGYAETIFINDSANADISFFAQTKEIPFAGTAALAVTGMLHTLTGKNPTRLVSQNHSIPVDVKDGLVWVDADLSIMPAWNHKRLGSVEEVERMKAKEAERLEHTMVWAWSDRESGTIRARTFATDWLLPEVEANGSGSMMLASRLRRPIVIKHGKGSKIFAESALNNRAKLGGHVVASGSPVRQLDS
jgi:predicted PhzF superfamily epimerase YddE/YHI9